MKALILEDDDLVAELLETVVAGQQNSEAYRRLLRRLGMDVEDHQKE